MAKRILAIDFDGTCVEHEYPKVGRDVQGAVRVLKRCVVDGDRLILWTMRCDSEADGPVLTDAVKWFESHGIPLYGINQNPDQSWSCSPKAYAHLYIDDAALGCPLRRAGSGRACVDWALIEELLFPSYLIQ